MKLKYASGCTPACLTYFSFPTLPRWAIFQSDLCSICLFKYLLPEKRSIKVGNEMERVRVICAVSVNLLLLYCTVCVGRS